MRLDYSVGSRRQIAHHAFKIAVAAELHHGPQIHSGLKQAGNAGGAELVQPPPLTLLMRLTACAVVAIQARRFFGGGPSSLRRSPCFCLPSFNRPSTYTPDRLLRGDILSLQSKIAVPIGK